MTQVLRWSRQVVGSNPGLVTVALAAVAGYLLRETLVGDAQVHLAFAENFANGHAFEYNLSGERVMASSSPLWTMVLWTSFAFLHLWTPVVLKVLVSLLWCVLCLLFAGAANKLQPGRAGLQWATCLAFALNPVLIVNALGGMENVLTAVQVLLLVTIIPRYFHRGGFLAAAGVGVLCGVTALTRIDGALLCTMPLLSFVLIRARLAGLRRSLGEVAVVLFAAAVIMLPWFLFQHSRTGGVFSDSALARVLHGRRGASQVLPGVFFNGKAIMATTLLLGPILSCGCAGMKRVIASVRISARGEPDSTAFAVTSHFFIVLVALLFYTFIVGADHYGRYFLPAFPSLYLLGMIGWDSVQSWARRYLGAPRAPVIALLLIGYLSAAFGVEAWRRFVLHQQYDPNALSEVLRLSQNRPATTDQLLSELGLTGRDRVKIAMTEVQRRYVLDKRVEILSLDGRTSPQILRYMERDGVPDFRAFLLAHQPDAVELGQWSSPNDWYSRLVGRRTRPNLVGELTVRLDGESDGYTVSLGGIRATKRGDFAVLAYRAQE